MRYARVETGFELAQDFDELREGIHALTMKTLSPDEWSGAGVENPAPPCLGGSKADG